MASHEAGTEFLLITVPAEKSADETWQRLDKRTGKDSGLSTNVPFNIPDLRVGTLDSLMSLSDELVKQDAFVEGTVRKIERQLKDLQKTETPQVNEGSVEAYLRSFCWDEARYPVKNPLRGIVDLICKQTSQLEEDLKVKASDYQGIKTTLANIERKAGGNLLVRDLCDVVAREDIIESENMETILVVVPKYLVKEFQTCYENISNFVVPRSAKMLAEDNEFELHRVIVFRRTADDFRHGCRERRFNIREFAFSEAEVVKGKEEKLKMESTLSTQWSNLLRWCMTGFGEAFIAWIHLKAVRVFVESVLRYGLPANFMAVLLKPHKKSHKKLRHALNELYGYLGGARFTGDDSGELAGQEMYPYVSFTLLALLD